MTVLDFIVIAILFGAVMAGRGKGLIRTVFDLLSSVCSLLITAKAYPSVSRILRKTPLFDWLKDWVVESMGLEKMVAAQTARAQSEWINGLQLPDFITKSLLANNNPEIHRLLNVSGIVDYVGAYFANMLINVVAFIITFIVIGALLELVGKALGLAGKLPVIRTLNRTGGALAGFALGSIAIWILCVIVAFVLVRPENAGFYGMLYRSGVALWYFEHNWLMDIVMGILA